MGSYIIAGYVSLPLVSKPLHWTQSAKASQCLAVLGGDSKKRQKEILLSPPWQRAAVPYPATPEHTLFPPSSLGLEGGEVIKIIEVLQGIKERAI